MPGITLNPAIEAWMRNRNLGGFSPRSEFSFASQELNQEGQEVQGLELDRWESELEEYSRKLDLKAIRNDHKLAKLQHLKVRMLKGKRFT